MVLIGISILNLDEYENSLYNNGIHQNIKFVKDYLDSLSNVKTLFISSLETKCKTALNFSETNKLKRFDYILIIGLVPAPDILKDLKKYTKIIWWCLGNDLVHDVNFILNPIKNYVSTLQTKDFSIADEVWISPHFEYSIDYYKYVFNMENIKIAPYIWSSEYMDSPYNDEFNHDEINIGVFESNLVYNKSCFLPIIICETAKEFIKKAFICNSKKLYERSKDFKHFINKSTLYKQKRLTIEKRHRFKYIMDNYCNVVVSFVENWDLNYLFLECFFLGIPLVHNSKMLKDWGYYYESHNVSQAVKHIQTIKQSFNRKEYIERHKPLIFKYSTKNPEYIKFFKNNLSVNKIKKNIPADIKKDTNSQYSIDRSKCWYDDFTKKKYTSNYKSFGKPSYNYSLTIKNEEIYKINSNVHSSSQFRLTSFIISVDEIRKKDMEEKIVSNFYFIDSDIFPKKINKIEKSRILGYNHIKCWRKATELNLDGALFFEDDVMFIHNWKNILQKFIDDKKPDVVRLDSIPYRIFMENQEESIYFYKEISRWCTGGYYMSKAAIKHSLEFFDKRDWIWNTCEIAFSEAYQAFHDNIYTSSPRICIQDWYKYQKSTIQNSIHMNNLKNAQIDFYLKKYGKYYPDWIQNYSDTSYNIVNNHKNDLRSLSKNSKINLKINNWRGGIGQNIIQVRNVIQIALYYNYNIILPEHMLFSTTYIKINKK